MKKQDLEKLLMDPEGLKRLSERALAIKQKYGEAGSGAQAASKIRPVQPLAHEIRPTVEEIRANDLAHLERKPVLANIERFMPNWPAKTRARRSASWFRAAKRAVPPATSSSARMPLTA